MPQDLIIYVLVVYSHYISRKVSFKLDGEHCYCFIVLPYGSLVEVDSNMENSQKLKQLEGGKTLR